MPYLIADFLAGTTFAVTGASRDRSKYGNKVLRCYQQHGLEVAGVNPRETEVEGAPCARDLSSLPWVPHGVSLVTPPVLAEGFVEEAARLGIRHLWFQPGADSPAALERARELGLAVIAGGPCLLVELGFRDRDPS